jgi:hypothetical protein
MPDEMISTLIVKFLLLEYQFVPFAPYEFQMFKQYPQFSLLERDVLADRSQGNGSRGLKKGPQSSR